MSGMRGLEEGTAPATAGSYGVAPRGGGRLPDATRLGAVHLQVADLARSRDFYLRVLGLVPLPPEALARAPLADGAGGTGAAVGRDAHRAVRLALGAPGGDAPLVVLHERRGARPAPGRGRTGLYHVAILLPDRADLGRFVRHLAALGVPAGAADHLVSEAVYLQDPDNLGIEVYADRPRPTWRRVGRELAMATDPLDVDDLVRTAGDAAWSGAPSGTVIGHVHLHVGDLDGADAFYVEALGFDRMVTRYPGARFVAAGGYHHHLGLNTWAGAGAHAAADDEAQLLAWSLELPGRTDALAAAARLRAAGHATVSWTDGAGAETLVVRDPWGTVLQLRVRDG